MRHDTNTVPAITGKVITYIKEKLPAIAEILYFNDRVASQNKNLQIFSNLSYYEVDLGIKA